LESEKPVVAIEAAAQCSIVGQATLVGHCAGSRQCGWVVGHSVGRPVQVGQAVALQLKKVKVAHTRLPSVGFRSLSRFLAVSLQVT